ncbi:hypothetical protein M7784_17070 [Desulfovibrio aminophilus]|nr:hypothetical protein [Desulfovibrio aminophilus]MCM0756949.1 hypothetical protein [Desulfovibrio aminophilus]
MRARLTILALVLALLVPVSASALVAREDYAGPGTPPESLPTRAEAAKKTGDVTPRNLQRKQGGKASGSGSATNSSQSGAGSPSQ